jgi:hypothetical protein
MWGWGVDLGGGGDGTACATARGGSVAGSCALFCMLAPGHQRATQL